MQSAICSASRPADYRPSITSAMNVVRVAPMLINPGEMFELQVLSEVTPRAVTASGRIAGVVPQRRSGLPYNPGTGPEGELESMDRFFWYWMPGALIVGGTMALAAGASTELARFLAIVAGVSVLVCNWLGTQYLLRQRRRWAPD